MAILDRQFMGKEKSWVQQIAGKCFRLLPVIALLAAGASAVEMEAMMTREGDAGERIERMRRAVLGKEPAAVS